MANVKPFLVGEGVASNQSIYETTDTARHTPGTIAALGDGRTFEYVRYQTAESVTVGDLLVYTPHPATLEDLAAPTSHGVGETSIDVTVTATLVANELGGGVLNVENNDGEGQLYGIVGHAAHTSGTLSLQVDRPVATAITAASTTFSIQRGPTSVELAAAVAVSGDPVEVAAGVSLVALSSASAASPVYLWIQKTGLCSVTIAAGVPSIGEPITAGTPAGTFQLAFLDADAADTNALPILGYCMENSPNAADHSTVRLCIA